MSRPSTAPRKPAAPRSAPTRGSRARPTGRAHGTGSGPSRPSASGSGRSHTTTTRPDAPGARGPRATGPGKGGGSGGSRRLTITTADGDRPLLSLRALALVLTLLVAFAIVAPTARHALMQAEDLRRTEESLARAEEDEIRLAEELAMWDDPAYVQSQARDRLQYVMPDQRPYIVIDPETVTGGQTVEEIEEAERAAAVAAARPWYVNLQESVELAGAIPGHGPSTGDVPAPDLPVEENGDIELPTTDPVAD